MEASFGRTPHPDSLGYQAALDAGLAIVAEGSSVSALPYFDRAVALRGTGIALTNQGKCLRDLGRNDDAAVALRRAVTASGGRGHARTALISLLVEMNEFAEAVPLAQRAMMEEPDNPAVINVVASCFDGLIASQGDAMAMEQLTALRAHVRGLRARAHELQPEAREQWLQRRRERTFPVHSVTPSAASPLVPVEQARTAPVAWTPARAAAPPSAQPMSEAVGDVGARSRTTETATGDDIGGETTAAHDGAPDPGRGATKPRTPRLLRWVRTLLRLSHAGT